jgi:hypothetical protein
MNKEIQKVGNLFYLEKIDKNVSKQTYEPVSYEQWKMLRELEPAKFILDYVYYVKLKKEQYDAEVERRKYCEFECKGLTYNLHQSSIEDTKRLINDIKSGDRFEKWYNPELVESILNYVELLKQNENESRNTNN